jgi:hypothetical protein
MCFFAYKKARTLSKIVATPEHRLRHWSRNGCYRGEKVAELLDVPYFSQNIP